MSFVTIKIRRATTAQWNVSTKVLSIGELGLDTTLNKLKVGNGSSLWNALPYLNVLPSEFTELAQDAVESALTAGTGITKVYNDAANTITLAVDNTIANKTYVDNAVSGLGSTAAITYVPVSDVGNPDGVASLDGTGKIPDSEISAEITRNTFAQTLTNKTIGLGTGITSIYGIDNIQGLAGQNNISIYQSGLDKGGRINISSLGVISIANSGIGYVSGLVTNAGGTRFNITVGGNTLSGTLAEFNAALTDGDFATQSYVATAVSNLLDSAPETLNTLNELAAAINDDASYAATITTALGNKAPLNSPTFTGTVILPTETISNADIHWEHYDTESNLPSAALKHGMFAHVHGTGAAYYAHSGAWYKLAKQTDSDLKAPLESPTFTGTVSGITKSMVGLGNVDNTSDDTKALISYIALSGATRTISSTTDKNKLIECSNACTITIPNDTQDAGWPVGSMVEVRQVGTGQVTITKDAAVTMVGADSQFKTRVQWSTIMLEKRSANSWLVTGDTTA